MPVEVAHYDFPKAGEGSRGWPASLDNNPRFGGYAMDSVRIRTRCLIILPFSASASHMRGKSSMAGRPVM